MPVYVALLRGINVSGQKIVKMDALRTLLESGGFEDVKTYIQSGNIIFRQEVENTRSLADRIAGLIQDHFGYEVTTLVLTREFLRIVWTENPYIHNPTIATKHLYVTLIQGDADKEGIVNLESLVADDADSFHLGNGCIYLHCPNGYGRTKLDHNRMERMLKIKGTSRNWRTLTKLVELSNDYHD
jgi:uncharacterized protein (DUF1697 family)